MKQKDIVFLADPHPFTLKGISHYLEHELDPPMTIAFQTQSGKELVDRLRPNEPVLVIMDLNLLDYDGFEVMEKVKRQKLKARFLIISAYADPKIVRKSIRLGAGGYMLKYHSPIKIKHAISAVLAGETYLGEGVNGQYNQQRSVNLNDDFARKYLLTNREIEVLRLISTALSNKEIASRLYISDQTVGVHRKNIMRKLGVNNVAELMRTTFEHSLV